MPVPPLILAARRGDVPELERLVRAGIDVNEADVVGFTALLAASAAGYEPAVAVLLSAGADVQRKACDGTTALLAAAWIGSASLMRRLRAAGAAPTEYEGREAMARAAFRGDAETMQELIDVATVGKEDAARFIHQRLARDGARFALAESGGEASLPSGNSDIPDFVSPDVFLFDGRHATPKDLPAQVRSRVRFTEREGALAEVVFEEFRFEYIRFVASPLPVATGAGLAGGFVDLGPPQLRYSEAASELLHGAALPDRVRRARLADSLSAYWHEEVLRRLEPATLDGDVLHRLVLKAASANRQDVLALLIEQAADRLSTRTKALALSSAAGAGHLRMIDQLLDAGVDPRGEGVLHAAAGAKSATALRRLLKAGALPDGRGRGGETPLMEAAGRWYDAPLRALLAAGADPAAQDGQGRTALHHSVDCENPKAARALIEAGAQVDARDHDGRTPLMLAAAADRRERMVRLFLKAGAQVDARNSAGRTPLHLALGNGRLGAVRLLLSVAAPADARDANGRTPLMEALGLFGYGHWHDVVSMLLKASDLEATDADGRTALALAARDDRPLAVRALLESGARADVVDREGKTVLDRACAGQYSKMVMEELSRYHPVKAEP